MDRKKISSFTDLNTWQEAHSLVLIIYKLTKTFPKEELFSLTDQMKRSAISISSNIAEGLGRKTYKDKSHFYYQAYGSLLELQNQLYIARDVSYISSDQFGEFITKTLILAKLLQALIKKSQTFL